MVLPYWFNRSEMLEIYCLNKHKIKKGKLLRLKSECIQIREDVEVGIGNEFSRLSMNDIVGKAVKGAI